MYFKDIRTFVQLQNICCVMCTFDYLAKALRYNMYSQISLTLLAGAFTEWEGSVQLAFFH